MKNDPWTTLMNEAQKTFLGEITVPRISVSSVLAEWARNPVVKAASAKGVEPYIYVAPPRFDNDTVTKPFYGWFMLEWCFKGSVDPIRFRVYTSFNPEAHSPVCVMIDEHFTPSQASYCAVMQKDLFLSDLEALVQSHEGIEQRDPRMKSRQDIPRKLSSRVFSGKPHGLIPSNSQILDEGHKLSCALMKTVYDTMPFVKDEELDEFIRVSDLTLAPVYMPMSSTVSFVSNIIT